MSPMGTLRYTTQGYVSPGKTWPCRLLNVAQSSHGDECLLSVSGLPLLPEADFTATRSGAAQTCQSVRPVQDKSVQVVDQPIGVPERGVMVTAPRRNHLRSHLLRGSGLLTTSR